MPLFTAEITFLGQSAGMLEARPDEGTIKFRPTRWGVKHHKKIRRELRSVMSEFRDTETLERDEPRQIRRVVIGPMTESPNDAPR